MSIECIVHGLRHPCHWLNAFDMIQQAVNCAIDSLTHTSVTGSSGIGVLLCISPLLTALPLSSSCYRLFSFMGLWGWDHRQCNSSH